MSYLFKLLFILIVFCNQLFAAQTPLKIAIANDMIPFSYLDENNKPNGILVDYWKLWSKKTNTKIVFVPSSWKDTLQNIKDKKVDIHSGLFKNQERQEYIKYLEPIYNTTSNIYINKKNIHKITKIEYLDNKYMGLINNSYYENYIKERYPQINIKQYNNYKDLLFALLNGEVDSFFDDSLTVWFNLIKFMRFDDVIALSDIKINNFYYAGIIKNNKSLESLVLEGMNKISFEELIDIENKWVLNKELKYFRNQKALFTFEELQYIKKAPEILIGVDSFPPFYFVNSKNEFDGIVSEFFRVFSQISGLKFKAVKGAWADNLNDFKNNKLDILPGVFYTKKRAEFGLYSSGYLDIRTSLIIKDKNVNINSLKDLKGKRLAITKNDARVEKIKELYKEIIIVETKDIQDSLHKLLNDEVDAVAELDIIAQYLIKKELFQGLKIVHQNEIKSLSLHFFSQKSDSLLHSILQKTLDSMSNEKKDEIVSKWIFSNIKNNLNIALLTDREPYNITNSLLKGIEYDIVEKVLNRAGIKINSSKNISYTNLQTALAKDTKLDMAVGIKEKDDDFYYSNDFISFENVVVSRIEDNIFINKIDDLKNKRVAAFELANKYLGQEYKKVFDPKNINPLYKEYKDQKKQVIDFLNKKYDVIILDKNIFLWYLKKFTNDSVDKYKFDFIFPSKNSMKVAFRDKKIRDIFNDNLEKVKKSGDYRQIFYNYLQTDIYAKIKIDSLIASVVAKYIFTNELDKLKEIVQIFSSLDYIKKLEIFNNENKLLFSSSSELLKEHSVQDSFYFLSDAPQKVGSIKVYFDDEKLIDYSNASKLIPDLKEFEQLDTYSYIKSIYKRFGYLDEKITFTKKEKEFIKNNRVITFSESNWKPLFIDENDTYSGLIVDYIKIVEKMTGLEFKYVRSDVWIEALRKYKNKEVDVLPSMNKDESHAEYGLLSNSYSSFNLVIVTSKDGSFVNSVKELEDKTLALPVGFVSYNYIKKTYPNIKIIETKDNLEAMSLVSQGKAYAFVGHMAVTAYNIKNSFPNLKIAGITEYEYKHQFLVPKSKPELLSIINKVISAISQKQREDIKHRWLKIEVSTAIDYSIVYRIVGFFIIILVIVLYFTQRLSKAKREIEITNQKLNESIEKLEKSQEELEESNSELEVSVENLKKTQTKLVESEKMASLGNLVAGIAHEINTPIGIGLTGITHFLDITKDLEKKYELNRMSQEEFEDYLKTSKTLAVQINSNLDRTANLVRSFKQVAVDQTSEQKREFNLKKYIEDTILSINNVIKKTNLKIDINIEEDINITSYPGAYSQIITNLIINSIQHGYKHKKEGTILLDISLKNNYINIIYKDDGKGISKENLKQIFNPFFTTNRQHGGTGLGLNIIYNIVTSNLHGTIECDSKEGFGVVFKILIPIE